MIQRILRTLRGSGVENNDAAQLIVGLGNVGPKYQGTRHNLGFEVVHELAGRFDAGAPRKRFEANLFDVNYRGQKVVLVAPTTMMNNSGFAVSQVARWYDVEPQAVLVVYDELDLPFGRIRLRPSGGAGGHNGVKSIIEQLGTTDFPRLRIGVGRPTSGSTIGYLLSRFSADQRSEVPDVVARASDAAESWLHSGLEIAMNSFNANDTNSK